MNSIAIDTETYLIGPGRLAPRLVCLSYYQHGAQGLLTAAQAVPWLTEQLTEGARIVGHNIAFDMAVMVEAGLPISLVMDAYDEGQVVCTMVHQRLIKIALGRYRFDPITGKPPGFSLADLAAEYLDEAVEGKKGADAWRMRYHELDGVPVSEWPAPARAYALKDAELTYRAHRRQVSEHQKIDEAVIVEQSKVHFALHLMSCWGLCTDPEAVERLEAALGHDWAADLAKLQALGFYRKNGTQDKKAVQARVTQVYGEAAPRTEKGAIKTSRAVLEASGDADLKALALASANKKELDSFIPVLKRGSLWPINPRFNVLVSSGRTSCSKPNIQQLPRRPGVRECIIPRPGWVFVAADYATAELRSLAQLLLQMFGKSKMAEALQDNRELHLEVAAELLGCSYEEAAARRAAGDKEVKEARDLAKPCNFGFPGGLGADKWVEFAREYVRRPDGSFPPFAERFDKAYAEGLKAAWLRRWPEMRDYFQAVGDEVADGGGSFTYRHPSTGFVRGGVGYCDGCNHGFQHLTATGAKRAVWAVAKQCYTDVESPLYGARPVAFIHDEILIEAREEAAADAAECLGLVMREAMQPLTPDIPVLVDAHIMRRWSKAADAAYRDGQLIPWEDRDR